MQAYQTDKNGVFVGTVTCDESPLEPGVFLVPAGAVTTAPPAFGGGQQARWDGAQWLVEDAPIPEDPEEMTEDELRIIEIHRTLEDIDAAAVRPLRAIAAGANVQDDHDRLAALEAQAQALRVELAGLEGR